MTSMKPWVATALLAFVGWAAAQPEMVPDPDANDLIKDVGGMVQVSNSTTSVGSLMVGNLGEGFLQLTDAAGRPMVAAGTTNDGRGRVDAGPGNKCAPGGMGLTIPDCIIGPMQ